MFSTFNSLAEVPEAFREHYVMKGGKAVAEVSSDHPLVLNNATLLNEKTAAETKATSAETKALGLQADLDSAKASTLPRAHQAVPNADADLLRAVKEAGITKLEDFTTLKDEHATLKVKDAEVVKVKKAEEVGEAMGWDKAKTALLVPKIYDLSQVEVRTGADGKKTAVEKVKQADGSFVEKPFADVVSKTPDLAALAPSLATQSGTKVLGSTAGGGSPGNFFDSIRDGVKETETANSQKDNKPLAERLHIAA